MANIVTTNRPTICKGEPCLSCLLKSEVVELAEGVAIICSLELKPEGVNELDQGVDCPSWVLDPEADNVLEEDEIEDREIDETEETPELLQPYEFVGDSLVLVKDMLLQHGATLLTTSFVEAYNAMVQLTKFRVQQKIDVLNGKLADLLLKAMNKVRAGDIDRDDAIGMIEDFNTYVLEEQSTDSIIDATFNQIDDEIPDFDDVTLAEFEDELENDDLENDDEEEFEELEELDEDDY